MRNLISIVSKDLKIFGRSKVSALVTVVIPLLIVLLLGTAFSTNSLQGIRIGVYSDSYNELSESIISDFESKSFMIVRFDDDLLCSNSVRNGESKICIIFPADLSSQGEEESVKFYVDDSQINLAHLLINDVGSGISIKSSEIGEGLVNELIFALEGAKTSLPIQNERISSAESDLEKIDSGLSSVSSSVPDIGDALSELNNAKSLASQLNDSSSVVNGINDAITELNKISSSISEIDSDVSSIKTDNFRVSQSLGNINKEIEELILLLNAVSVTESGKIVSPIKTEIESVNKAGNNSNYIFPTFLALMILFGSILLSSVIALREKRNRAYFRNFVTPTSDFTFIMGMYITSLIIAVFQLAVLFSGLALIQGAGAFNLIGNLSLAIFIGASGFIFLGLFVGHLFKTNETAILASISVASLMMFFSNVIFPLEAITGEFQKYAVYNPLVLFSSVLKKIILFSSDLYSLLPEIYILIGVVFVFLFLTYLSRKFSKRRM